MNYDSVKTPDELFEFVKNNIKFGFVNQFNENRYRDLSSKLSFIAELLRYYHLQSPSELLDTKCGISFDQNELMASWLIEHEYKVSKYFIPNKIHSILIYEDNNRYNWIETSCKNAIGIHEFEHFDDIFSKYFALQNINSARIYKYKDLEYGSNFIDVIYNAKNGKLVIKK